MFLTGLLSIVLMGCKKAETSKIEKLVVCKKVYTGNMVGDGFYDSMSSLKSCDKQALLNDPQLADHFSNYDHIMKICENNPNIPPVGLDTAAEILGRLKKHVTDINGITVQHYTNAGHEGYYILPLSSTASLLKLIMEELMN